MALVEVLNTYTSLGRFLVTAGIVLLAACGTLDNSDLAGDADSRELKDSKKVSAINFNGNDELKSCVLDTGAEYVFELMALNCSYSNPPIEDLTGLENFTALRELYLFNSAIRTIEELKYLTKLEELYLFNNRIEDFTPIANLKSLEYLYIDNTDIKTLKPLRNLTNLTYLGASGNVGLTDLEWLKDMERLQSLDLRGKRDIDEEISNLSNLYSLKVLALADNDISDASYLKDLEGLTFLSLSYNSITRSCDLKKLINLTGLHLNNNFISDDVFCLRYMSKIEDAVDKRLILEGNNSIDCHDANELEKALEDDVTNDTKVIKPGGC